MAGQDRVLIAGAGPVGLIGALALAKAGVPVTLMDGLSQPAEDLRASTFHPPSLEMIADLVVHTVMNLSADLLEVPAPSQVREHELTARAIKQLRVIFLGASQWRADRGAVPPVQPITVDTLQGNRSS